MYCSKCGKKIADDAVFCDGCGAKVGGGVSQTSKKEGEVHKCPYCGEILSHDELKCPSCGKEIRGREVSHSLQSFFDKINSTDDEDKKIELIKTFPIPNNREDIIEFMFLACTNYDAAYFATNKNKDSIASAWLSKIEQCYAKGKSMLTSRADLSQLESLYDKVCQQTKKIRTIKLILIVAGLVLSPSGLAIVSVWGTNNTAIGAVGLALLALGIISLVFGFKRKKTNKEIEEEKAEKAKKQALKQKDNQKEEVVVHQTIVKHEYIEKETPTEVEKEEPKKEVSTTIKEDGSVIYPDEEVETYNKLFIKRNEKIIIKMDIDYLNDDDENEYEVTLTNKALYYLKKDEDLEDIEETIRIPLCQISQAVYKKGGFLESRTLEIYREGAIDKMEGSKKLAILEQAINDRFDQSTMDRDYRFYDNLK